MAFSKNFLFIIMMAALLVTFNHTAAKSSEPEAGFIGYFNFFCMNKADAKTLSNAAAEFGDKGYLRVMNDEKVKCYKTKPVQVRLVEKVWDLTHLNGTLYQFWLVKNRVGAKAYTWLLIPDGKS